MRRKALIFLAILVGLWAHAALFSALPSAQAWTPSRAFFLVHKGIAVRIGSAFGDAMLAVQSDGTKDILSGYNSSGTEVVTVDASGDVTITQTLAVTGSAALTGATTFSDQVTVNDNLLVDGDGISDVQIRVDGTSGQVVDIFQVRGYDGTEYLDVSSAGATGVKSTLAVTGATTLSSTLAVTGVVTVDHVSGIEALDFDAQTADPCPGWGSAAPGRLFYSAGGFYCRCDASTDDIKGLGDGDTDACTY